MKKNTRRWLSLGITAAVLAWIIYHVAGSSEERAFDWNRLWSSLKHARTGYLLIATAATLSSYVVRAVRWRFFMDPIKRASLWVLFVGQVLGFSAVYLIGRPGEFVRPAYIAKKEGVAVTSMLAVWILERLYDTGFMMVLFVLAIYFAPMHQSAARAQGMPARPHHPPRFVPQLAHAVTWLLQRPHFLAGAILIALGLAIAVLVLIRLRAEKLAAWLASIFRFLPARVRHWLRGVFYSFVEGLGAIRNWKYEHGLVGVSEPGPRAESTIVDSRRFGIVLGGAGPGFPIARRRWRISGWCVCHLATPVCRTL
jgi:hypothetical protein